MRFNASRGLLHWRGLIIQHAIRDVNSVTLHANSIIGIPFLALATSVWERSNPNANGLGNTLGVNTGMSRHRS